jgi:hypothetical protein
LNRTIVRSALLASLLAATAASAATYPVSARLTVAPPLQQSCLKPPGQRPDCAVVEITHAAFAAAVSRMFLQSETPDLRLVLAVRKVEISSVVGLDLELATRVEVQTPAGETIDEIDSSVVVPLLAVEEGPISVALHDAAREAAAGFELNYANRSKVGDYLVSKKVASAKAVAVPERSDDLVTLAGGVGFMQGAGDGELTPAFSARIAGSAGFFFAQAVYWSSSANFQAADPATAGVPGQATMNTNGFGLDLGGVYHFTRALELRAGPGVHYVYGDASFRTASASFSKPVPTAYASLTWSFIPVHNSPRLVLGLEGRTYFFASVDLPQLLRSVPAANASLALTLGVEFSWAAKKEDAR